ncbi:MAG: TetR/AcrR family transcriptional regulator [Chitinophagales bacterium]|nr:TetR/AcrR family transcriptional regulator [Chitinophagales bacterium]
MQITHRQQQVIDACAKLLMTQGVQGLTTKNLAREIGFSESALYRHFASKESIIAFLLEFLFQDIQSRLTPIAMNSKSPSDQVKAIFESQFLFFEKHPFYLVAILSEGLFDASNEIKLAMMKIVNFKMQLLNQLIVKGIENRIFRADIPAEYLVHSLMGNFRLLCLKWKMQDFKFSLTHKGKEMMYYQIKILEK